ncbi:MAG TPA: DedA family protein [Bacteroidota bacterium]|nr:DedA family protein [Bacteroidota bacterium]
MEDFILSLQSLDPLLIYLAVFLIAFVENVFPPSPSDLVIVFAGSLVGIEHLGFVPALLTATAGSTLGFVAMYKIGDWFGDRVLEEGKIRFIPITAVKKVEAWFTRYGYWIIIANRFLAGTRAVVSFFAGMSELNLVKTTLLSFVSALVWNSILLAGGYALGSNWQKIGIYLSTYSQIVTGVLIVVVLMFVAKFLYQKNSKQKST